MTTEATTFTFADSKALCEMQPPLEGETIGQHVDRALKAGLITLGEAMYVGDTIGLKGLQEPVVRPFLPSHP